MQNPSIVLYGPGSAKLEDKPVPEIVDGHDVIVRIAFVGVCGSDVHFWNHGGIGKHVDLTAGIVMGHEASGTISSIGPAVTCVSVGDRVAIEPGVPCRFCSYCRSGSYHLCKDMRFAAAPGPPDTQGTLCKYFKVAEDFVYKVGDEMSLEETVLVEPTSVAVHAVKLADVRAGETVVVMGSGTIGLLCAAVARAFGAYRIILVDILDTKLEFAKLFLGCETFKPSTTASAEENASSLRSSLNLSSTCIDTVIEASGAAASIETGINVLRPGGKYVQTGMGKPKIEFPIGMISEKELMVRGCFRYGAGDYELAVSLLTRAIINVKPLISSTTRFEEATEAWKKTARGEGIKNLIRGVDD
ncbi:GroES-like protein [Lentithecium fluviatile CBS 122367]|uniref:D-xylulose reductase n=1 Tax=Lentithecium fluviatile CBS 122367 TaxID=1168545 RepID=A0A6G1ISQ4_9PLEO|nr:GroES-like protein [Lentithecium fluviatile CBS 122367]